MKDRKTPDGEPFTIDRFMERRRALRNEFATYQKSYTDISANFRPRRGFYINQTDAGNNAAINGYNRNQQIINSTVSRVSKNAQSGLQAGVTSPSRPWKKLSFQDPDLNEIPGAQLAMSKLDRSFDFVLQKSNFYRATHTAYADFVDFGPAAIQIDSHPTNIIRCQAHPVGSWVGACNADGRVDVFYRDYRPTGYELVSKFGKDNLPQEVRNMVQKSPYGRHDVINAIEPNPYFVGGPAIGLASFPYISVWWIKGYEQDFLHTHGYHEFPVMVFRFYKSEMNDPYGYAPGVDALGDAKQLQHQERTKLVGMEQMVKPALQAPTALRSKGVAMIPGKVNYHDGPGKVESLYNVNLPLNYVLQDIDGIQQRLSEAYFEDLFLMVSNSVTRQTTAREIEERHEEKLIMLGPVLESIHDELLDPAVERILALMRRAGKWPEFPQELQGQELDTEYISILAQAQRAVQTVAIEQGFNFVASASQFKPEILDRVSADGMADEYFNRIGFPPAAVVSISDAEGARAERAKAAAQAQQIATAGAAAEVAESAANAQATANDAQIAPNVLDRVLGT